MKRFNLTDKILGTLAISSVIGVIVSAAFGSMSVEIYSGVVAYLTVLPLLIRSIVGQSKS